MDRRTFLISSSVAVTGTFLPFKKLLAFEWGAFTPIRRNTGIFTGRGGTIGWLAASDVLIVVDSQFPDSAKECLEGLAQRTSHPVDMLINTHHHGDHTAGNPVFQGVARQIVAHENVPGLMKQSAQGSENEPAYPDTTYSESWKADAGDEVVHVNHYGPAHTGGDSVVYFEKANVIHMGDLIFNRRNPFIDRPGGASVRNWVATLDKVTETYPADSVYIFGHAGQGFEVTGDREDVMVMRNYLQALLDHVQAGLDAGKSKEEIVEIDQLEGYPEFASRGGGRLTLSGNLEVAYAELTEGK